MIETIGLTKRYGAVTALAGLTLSVREGEVLGLLGPNGSGKTTTIRLCLGLIKPTAGSASVLGFDCWTQSYDVRTMVGYLGGELRLPGAMSGWGFLKYLAALRNGAGFDRAAAIAQTLMELDLKRKIRTYSTGMKQKLALAQAFAEPVRILILDEPTSAARSVGPRPGDEPGRRGSRTRTDGPLLGARVVRSGAGRRPGGDSPQGAVDAY